MVDEQAVNVIILVDIHTLGKEEYFALRDQFIRCSEGFILVYSIVDKSSFNQMSLVIRQIQTIKEVDHSPTVIIGNLCDLESERQVQTHEGEMMAEKYKTAFFETSAMFGINVDEAVHTLVKEVYTSRSINRATKMVNKKKQCVIY